jgi:hypothetical protein
LVSPTSSQFSWLNISSGGSLASVSKINQTLETAATGNRIHWPKKTLPGRPSRFVLLELILLAVFKVLFSGTLIILIEKE